MEKKVVLIVLIVIAVAAAVFLGVGAAQDGRGAGFDPENPGSFFEKLDGLFKRSRKPFDIRRMPARLMTGCTISGRVITFNAQCDVAVDSSKTKSSEFKLTNLNGLILGAYAFSRDELEELWAKPKNRSQLKADPVPRFVVTKDGAFLRLACQTGTTAPCSVTVE